MMKWYTIEQMNKTYEKNKSIISDLSDWALGLFPEIIIFLKNRLSESYIFHLLNLNEKHPKNHMHHKKLWLA